MRLSPSEQKEIKWKGPSLLKSAPAFLGGVSLEVCELSLSTMEAGSRDVLRLPTLCSFLLYLHGFVVVYLFVLFFGWL